MRKVVLGLFLASVVASCSKNDHDFTDIKPYVEPKPTGQAGKSYIKITVDKKTDFQVKDTIVTYPGASPKLYPFYTKFETAPHVWGGNLYDKTFSMNSFVGDTYTKGNMKFIIAATSYASNNTSYVDEYKTLSNSEAAFSIEDTKTNTIYKIKTGSMIRVKVSDADHCEGELELFLVDPAGGPDLKGVGEFKIYYHL